MEECWNEHTITTIKQLQSDIREASFIYGERLEILENNMNRLVVIPLIVCSVLTVFAGVAVALNAQEEISNWIPFSFEVIILLGTATASICTGLIKVWGLEENIKVLTKHIERLDFEWAILESGLNDQTLNGSDFLKRENGNYLHLMQQAPHISSSDYFEAKKAYLQKMKEYEDWEKQQTV